MCDEWRDDFGAFLRDMGERPPGTTLDRFPNRQGNYEPGNCRWATAIEQTENRDQFTPNNQWGGPRMLTHGGETMSVADWARHLGVSVNRLHSRLRQGWSVHDVLTLPPRQGHPPGGRQPSRRQ